MLRSLPRANSTRPSTTTLTSATGMESTMPPSLPPWGITRCKCSEKPLLGCIISRCTGYRAVHYFSIILTIIYSESTRRSISPLGSGLHARAEATVSPAFAMKAPARVPCAAGVWTRSEEASSITGHRSSRPGGIGHYLLNCNRSSQALRRRKYSPSPLPATAPSRVRKNRGTPPQESWRS